MACAKFVVDASFSHPRYHLRNPGKKGGIFLVVCCNWGSSYYSHSNLRESIRILGTAAGDFLDPSEGNILEYHPKRTFFDG